jgi:hypothetical protein
MTIAALRNLAEELSNSLLQSLLLAIEENHASHIHTAIRAAQSGRRSCSFIFSQYHIRLTHVPEEIDSLGVSRANSSSSLEMAIESPVIEEKTTFSSLHLERPTINRYPSSASSTTISPGSAPYSPYDNLSYLPTMRWFDKKRTPTSPEAPKRRFSFLSRRDSANQTLTPPISPIAGSSFPFSRSESYSPSVDTSSPSWSGASKALLRMPTSQNNYLGLCRGATDLARGDEKAFTEEFEWAFGKVPFLQCAHCAFSCKINRTKVWETKRGIRFRWAFLAKSHVAQSKVERATHTYKCIFCSYSGIDGPCVQGEDAFLEHLAIHRNINYGDAMLNVTRCINDRYAHQSEDWDINLVPTETFAHVDRMKNTTVNDSHRSPIELPTSPMSMGPFELE